MEIPQIPEYVPHEGTIKVAGATVSKSAARCALHFLAADKQNIEFFYIGANAGQQAMKAMGIFRYVLERLTENSLTAVFQPERVKTWVASEGAYRDAVVWRVFVVAPDTVKPSAAISAHRESLKQAQV